MIVAKRQQPIPTAKAAFAFAFAGSSGDPSDIVKKTDDKDKTNKQKANKYCFLDWGVRQINNWLPRKMGAFIPFTECAFVNHKAVEV